MLVVINILKQKRHSSYVFGVHRSERHISRTRVERYPVGGSAEPTTKAGDAGFCCGFVIFVILGR